MRKLGNNGSKSAIFAVLAAAAANKAAAVQETDKQTQQMRRKGPTALAWPPLLSFTMVVVGLTMYIEARPSWLASG